MRTLRSLALAAAAAAFVAHLPTPAAAQNQDYFIPGQQKPAAPHAAPAQRPLRPAAPGMAPGMGQPEPPPQVNVELPPPPELPPVPKGEKPPAAVIGVLGVPEVMHASTAAQEVEKIIGVRRAKLNDDAQKEQQAWREIEQTLANDRGKLSGEQLRARERKLQERVTNAQRTFRERNRVIQEAAQYALAQIERTLVQVIRQVAESRGMNLVLHRSQVALNVNPFDITPAVTAQLNKVLPHVVVPPDGMTPAEMVAAAKKQAAKEAAKKPAAEKKHAKESAQGGTAAPKAAQ